MRSSIATAPSLTAASTELVGRQRRIGAKAKDAGLEVVSVNALYPFNVWNEERARQTEALAGLAAAANATRPGHVPAERRRDLEDTPEKAAALRAALTAWRRVLEAH